MRSDLAEVGRALTEAVPRHAIEALEGEVRALAERLDRTRQAGADGSALGALERGLAEVRDALHGLTPAESLVGFEDAVRALSHKIDQIATSASGGGNDPLALRQIEQAMVSLRDVVSNVASDEALAQLSADRTCTSTRREQLERAAEARITTVMESGRAVPPELEGAIHALSERLDRMQLSQGDQLALVALEDRIAKLSEKLDTSDGRLRQFDAIERGLSDLLVYLEEMRKDGPGLRAASAAASEQAAAAQPPRSPLGLLADPPQPAAVASQPLRSPLDLLADPSRPAAVAPQPPRSPLDLLDQPQPVPVAASMPVQPPAPPPPVPVAAPRLVSPPAPPAPAPSPSPQPKPMARTPERAPIEPYLPPDTPLEPGSGAPRVKPGSPAARIAASEAALGQARPAANDHGGKSAMIAAARNAAKAAYLDTPVKVPAGLGPRVGGLLKWPFKKRPDAPTQQPPQNLPKLPPELAAAPSIQPALPAGAMSHDAALDRPLPRSARALRFVKTVLIAASVAIIVVGATQTALELLFPDEPFKTPVSEQPQEKPESRRRSRRRRDRSPFRAGRCRHRSARCRPRRLPSPRHRPQTIARRSSTPRP